MGDAYWEHTRQKGKRVAVIIGGGEEARDLCTWSANNKLQVIYGHTSPLDSRFKETRLVTPYSVDPGDFDSLLSVFRAAKNRHHQIDNFVYVLSPRLAHGSGSGSQNGQANGTHKVEHSYDPNRPRDTLWEVVLWTKVVMYYLRRDFRPGHRRVVLVFPQQTDDIENRTSWTAILGFYRSMISKFQSVDAEFDLVISQNGCKWEPARMVPLIIEHPPRDAHNDAPAVGDAVCRVHIVSSSPGSEESIIVSQDSEVGQVRGPSVERLQGRLAGLGALLSRVLRLHLRFSMAIASLRSTPVVGPLLGLAPHFAILGLVWVGWKVVQLDIRWAAPFIALAEIALIPRLFASNRRKPRP